VRIREACSTVIQKEAIAEHIAQCDNAPAQTFAPPCLLLHTPAIKAADLEKGRALIASYCEEKGCSPESISITLAFSAGDRSSKTAQAIQQDLQALGITLLLQPCESRHFYTRVSQLDYDLSLGSWYADYFDPYSFYGVLERTTNGTNNTGWESIHYQKLLGESQRTSDPDLRHEKFLELEAILAKELPIIPLYHASFAYVKRPTVEGLSISPLGHIDVAR
jgi:oligopeptide transport system substrate-binding protein